MKIGAGIYKNRCVKVLGDISRPTTVRSRTVIFDILHNICEEGFSFLDTFAGSGIMGMEALSRGAGKAVFFELNGGCVKLIEENLKKMDKLHGMYFVHKCNVLVPPKGTPMDIIFMDPPYEKSFIINSAIKKLWKYNWIDENTIIIIETSIYHKLTKGSHVIFTDLEKRFNKRTKIKPTIYSDDDYRDHIELKLWRYKEISKSLIQFFTVNLPKNIDKIHDNSEDLQDISENLA